MEIILTVFYSILSINFIQLLLIFNIFLALAGEASVPLFQLSSIMSQYVDVNLYIHNQYVDRDACNLCIP
jgi:hypothetical protein